MILDLGPLPDRLTARLGISLADQVLCVVPAGETAQCVEQTLFQVNRLAPHRGLVVFNVASALDPMLDKRMLEELTTEPSVSLSV